MSVNAPRGLMVLAEAFGYAGLGVCVNARWAGFAPANGSLGAWRPCAGARRRRRATHEAGIGGAA